MSEVSTPKKIFIMSGEVSGDRLGAWYLRKAHVLHPEIVCEAIGGSFLESAGAVLYERLEKLTAVGIIEIIPRIPFFLRFLKRLAHYIQTNRFDEVVLVDFPGFNLRLAAMLKKYAPDVKIIYFSPPQLWAWGAWRLKNLKRYCDRIIVLYPFEVEWYKERGVSVEWCGYPGYETYRPYAATFGRERSNTIAIVIGSRASEIKALLPLYVASMKILKARYAHLRFVVPCAESFSRSFLIEAFTSNGYEPRGGDIDFVKGEQEKNEALSQCSVALSKPGTVTLQLGLLGVPTVVAYKTSFLTFHLGRQVVKVPFMSLPNLLLNKAVFPEFIQKAALPERLAQEVAALFEAYTHQQPLYQERLDGLSPLHTLLNP